MKLAFKKNSTAYSLEVEWENNEAFEKYGTPVSEGEEGRICSIPKLRCVSAKHRGLLVHTRTFECRERAQFSSGKTELSVDRDVLLLLSATARCLLPSLILELLSAPVFLFCCFVPTVWYSPGSQHHLIRTVTVFTPFPWHSHHALHGLSAHQAALLHHRDRRSLSLHPLQCLQT